MERWILRCLAMFVGLGKAPSVYVMKHVTVQYANKSRPPAVA